MRNPNGYGGISQLGGNRRNPFRVRITSGWEYDEKTGKHKQKYSTLGYYPTRKAAMMALARYNENPYDIDAAKITFKEVYEKWSVKKYPTMSESGRRQYEAAYAKFKAVENMKMADLKKKHLQTAFDDNSHLSRVFQEKMKALLRYMYRYCIEYDVLTKDYSQFITLTAENKKDSIHAPFTQEEIRKLWDNLSLGIPLEYSRKDVRDIFPVDTVLILIYTGMRPGEILKIECDKVNLEERYMIGGFKTDAGKDRIIPIHDDIFELVKARVEKGGRYLVPYKSDAPPKLQQYRTYFWDPMMEKLKISHLPHDGRYTFATFADKCGLDPFMVKRIMGHKITDITQGVYTKKEAADLVAECNKIVFCEK